MPPFCLPAFSGVPGTPATNLEWWTPSSPFAQEDYPDDPNWLGAFSIAHGGGAGAQIRFRALNGVHGGTRMLYLSWIAQVAPAPTEARDGVTLLIGSAAQAIVVKVRLDTTSSTIAGDASKYAIQTNSYSGGALGGAHGSVPAWATNTGRVWVDFTSPTTGLYIPWAFQIAVPLGANLAPAGSPSVTVPFAADFKLWYQVMVTTATGAAVPYSWVGTPTSNSEIDVIPPGLAPADVRVPGPGDACAAGAGLSWSGVTIRNQDGTARASNHAIQLDLGKPYPPNNRPYDLNLPPDVLAPNHQNMFLAQPTTSGLSAAQVSSIRARFRLANWGIQYSSPTANSWKTIPGGEDVAYTTPAGQPAGMRVVWPRGGMNAAATAFTNTFINGVKTWLNTNGASGQHPHQCVLVELSSDATSGVIFTQSSVFVNTNVVSASTFERIAEVSVVGMQPISPVARDVYLFLETFNMPQKVEGEPGEGGGEPGEGGPDIVGGGVADGGLRGSMLFRRGEQQFYEVDDVLPFAPVYRVHGYADTGQLLELTDGSSVKILRPQTSFGYVAVHDGPLVGWETRLSGARRLAPNFYVLEVPNNGSMNILTQIQARESDAEAPLPPESERPMPRDDTPPAGEGCLGGLLRVLARLIRSLFWS